MQIRQLALSDTNTTISGPELMRLFSCSTQLSMKFVLLIKLKVFTIANSFLLNTADNENFSANIYEVPTIVGIIIFKSREIFMKNVL